MNRFIHRLTLTLTPFISPFTVWLYRSKFSRKTTIRLMIFIMITPVIGYFRRPYILKQFKSQLDNQNQIKQTQMKQTLGQAELDFTSSDNNFQYMILVKSQQKLQNDQELFEKQKILFTLNNQVLSKTLQSQNYFDGIKFVFVGQQKIYQGLTNNLSKQNQNQFDFIKKDIKSGGMMTIPKPDTILLVAKQSNGDNRIVMEWPFSHELNLKSIIRQISKHKHKKFVQSMNF